VMNITDREGQRFSNAWQEVSKLNSSNCARLRDGRGHLAQPPLDGGESGQF